MGDDGRHLHQDRAVARRQLDALKSGLAFKTNGMIEDVVKLHMELVALAFACNYNRVATLQWGDGTDGTKYNVPSNAEPRLAVPPPQPPRPVGRRDRQQPDRRAGARRDRQAAHADAAATASTQFKARGLQDKAIVMWTNHVADGPTHSVQNVPHIIWGNGGGYLKQGQYVDAGATSPTTSC